MALRLVLLVVLTLVVLTQSWRTDWFRPDVCRKTPTLDNGFIIKNEKKRVDYRCNTGYQLRVTGVCRGGSWRRQVSCQAVGCPGDQMITNSDDQTVPSTIGSTFTFNCNNGFTELGSTGTLTCGDQGQWQITLPCEPVKCSAGLVIGLPNSTDVTISGRFGDTFTFTCLPGFTELGDTGNMICGTDGSRGMWQILSPCLVPQN